jgi:NAD(P)-dependent dehydrogenase (short-subunit alcohol dehydrogenase family)
LNSRNADYKESGTGYEPSQTGRADGRGNQRRSGYIEILVTEPTGPLVGQVALVSGAARGVGLACARRIAENGADVVLTDVDVATGAESTRQLCADGLRASFALLDVSDVAAIRVCVADVVSSHGRLDVLVNNAGIALVAEIEDVTEQLWDRTFEVNLKGTFFLSQAVVPYMKAQRSGRIINVASVAARSGGLMPLAPYAASKAGIVNLTKSFAGRLLVGINVNAVAPGQLIRTGPTDR